MERWKKAVANAKILATRLNDLKATLQTVKTQQTILDDMLLKLGISHLNKQHREQNVTLDAIQQRLDDFDVRLNDIDKEVLGLLQTPSKAPNVDANLNTVLTDIDRYFSELTKINYTQQQQYQQYQQEHYFERGTVEERDSKRNRRNGGSRRRRRSLPKSSRKYKKSKRVFRKKSRSTRRR